MTAEEKLQLLQLIQEQDKVLQFTGKRIVLMAHEGIINIKGASLYKDMFPDTMTIREASDIADRFGLHIHIINMVPAPGCEPLPEEQAIC